MACPFPAALPQHNRQCWHNREPRSHRPAGLAQLMRPRWRLPMGTPQLVSKAARAFQHESRMPRRTQETSKVARGGPRMFQDTPGSPRRPQESPEGPSESLPRRPQEGPGGARSPSRKPQEVHEAPGSPRKLGWQNASHAQIGQLAWQNSCGHDCGGRWELAQRVSKAAPARGHPGAGR